jgi:hypothetical protein
MGAWGVDSFGNDDAADWAFGLDESHDLHLVEETLSRATVGSEEYLEAPVASEAVAAAEAVARLRGPAGESTGYSDSVDRWVARVGKPPSEAVVRLAIRALDRIVAPDSELRELWEDSEDFAAWTDAIRELRGRLVA